MADESLAVACPECGAEAGAACGQPIKLIRFRFICAARIWAAYKAREEARLYGRR